jgi:hypothetical protein
MRSPFPGMDPYLDDPGAWAGVHSALIAILREALNRQLGPGFVADGGTSVYILSLEERRWMCPDVFVIETPSPEPVSTRAGMIAAPVRINIAAPETISLPSILIRDREGRNIVTTIELLSPVNKGPESILRPGMGARAEFLPPPLRPDDARWVAERVQEWRASLPARQ